MENKEKNILKMEKVGILQAASIDDVSTIKLILNQKADQDLFTVNDDDWTALMIAAWKGHDDIVRTILSSYRPAVKTSINPLLHVDENGDSALTLAVYAGHLEVVIALLNEKYPELVKGDAQVCSDNNKSLFDINSRTFEGRTPLMIASSRRHLQIVKVRTICP